MVEKLGWKSVASTVVQRDDLMAGTTAVWLVAHWG